MLEEWTLQGFPDEVSEPIELPDIAELLLMPAFQGILAEDFLKHATDFQKELFNKIPLRNDHKYVTVRSSVNVLYPGSRSHTGHPYKRGWHIDGIDEGAQGYRVPSERVFILSSACTALTEFNLHPLTIQSPLMENRHEFTLRVNDKAEEMGVIGKAIEPNRIYTFTNHLHRAAEPERIEFRYFLRVRETSGSDVYSDKPASLVRTYDVNFERKIPSIQYQEDRITIFRPPLNLVDVID